LLYFAYGSNLDREQMQRRCPGARLVGRAVLHGYRLAFAGWSQGWGGGVATVEPCPGSHVPGAIYEVTAEHVATLDRAEGVPFAYQRERRQMKVRGKVRRPILYIKTNDDPCVPSLDYYSRIRDGRLANRLPLRDLSEAVRRAA
jgi:gamma-glutamylcyclotransferase (GGCT)/AIG2-like uncharacterized protein YtfP